MNRGDEPKGEWAEPSLRGDRDSSRNERITRGYEAGEKENPTFSFLIVELSHRP